MNNISIKNILKNELEFPLIALLIIVSEFIFNTLSVSIKLPEFYDYAIYISIGIFALCRLIRIKNVKKNIFVVCLLVYMTICTVSTFKYPAIYDTYVSEFFSLYKYYLILVLLIIPFPYSKNIENKIKIIEYLLVAAIIVIDILSLINGTVQGITIHKNHLGSMAVILTFISILNIDFDKWPSVIAYSLLIIFSAYMTVFSHSRASTLFVGLAIICFFGYKILNTIKNKKILIYCGIGFVALIAAVFFLKGKAIISYLFNADNIATLSFNEVLNKLLNGRADLWGQRLRECMKGDLLIGNGTNSYERVSYYKQVYLTSVSEGVTFLHNIILDAFYSSGIIGFFFFVAFFAGMIIYLKNNLFFPNTRTKRRLLLLILLFVYACIDMYFIWMVDARNIFIFLELCALLNEVDRQTIENEIVMENQNEDDIDDVDTINDLLKLDGIESIKDCVIEDDANEKENDIIEDENVEVLEENEDSYKIEEINNGFEQAEKEESVNNND